MSSTGTHILVYPFPTSGHIIPLLDLTRKLLNRGLRVTVLVTSNNLPLLQPLTSSHPSSQLQALTFPEQQNYNLVFSKNGLINKMQFVQQSHYSALLDWFRSHSSPPLAIISDFFLGWTNHLAREVGVPRLVFSPSGSLAFSISVCTWRDRPRNDQPGNPDFPVSFPQIPNSPTCPWWQLSRFYRKNEEREDWEFMRDNYLANVASWGVVFNSFAALESDYLNHMKEKEFGDDRVWAVGPVLPPEDDSVGPANRGGSSTVSCHEVLTWLDSKKDNSVVYVCFGSRQVLTCDQMNELAAGLEKSGVHFVWCVRQQGNGVYAASDAGSLPVGFEDRVAGRGFFIKGWAPQVAILRHRAVGSFLTHCGWNSVLEGVAAGTVMLTWPMSADQFTNARLLVDELGVGIRVGEAALKIPKADELAELLKKSVEENCPERGKAKKLKEAALSAIRGGGSSDKDLEQLVNSLNKLNNQSLGCVIESRAGEAVAVANGV